MRYRPMIRFLVPLAIAIIIEGIGIQFLNGGMARMPDAMVTLASFGVAWGLVAFCNSTLWRIRQTTLVLVDSRDGYRQVVRFVIGVGGLLTLILLSMALTPFGDWFLNMLHGLPPDVATTVKDLLFWLAPVPLIMGMYRVFEGVLYRGKRTEIVSAAIIGKVIAGLTAVFLLLPTQFVTENPTWFPIIVVYAGVSTEFIISFWGFYRFAEKELTEEGPELEFRTIFQFFWPLAFITLVQGGSRPLINLFVARQAEGAVALAVLAVVFPLVNLPYSWVNWIRNLAPAFKGRRDHLKDIKVVAFGCGLVSFFLMVLIFWTPLRDIILMDLIGVNAQLAGLSALPLMISVLFPLIVMVRAYFHGIGLEERMTKALAPSAPMRLLFILLGLIALSLFGLYGATLGMAAMLVGFTAETFVVWWGVRGKFRWWGRTLPVKP